MVDLGDIEHRGHAGVELAQRAEELGNVHVFRSIDAGELAQHEIEIVHLAVRQAVVEQQAIGQEAAQRGLELVMVGIDEARHDDHAVGLDHVGATGIEVRPHGGNPAAVDQHVGDGEIADPGIHGQNRAATDDVAPAGSPSVCGQGRALSTRRLPVHKHRANGGCPGAPGGQEKVAP